MPEKNTVSDIFFFDVAFSFYNLKNPELNVDKEKTMIFMFLNSNITIS